MRFLALVAGLALSVEVAGAQSAIQPAPQTPHAVRVSGGVMAAKLLHKTPPLYPREAKVQHVSGAVVMLARIGTDGRVVELKVISGPELLRQSALDAVSHWLYEPYLLNGEPVEVETTVTVNFLFTEEPDLKPLPPEGVPPELAQVAAPEDKPVRLSGGVVAGHILTKRQPVFRPEVLCQHVSINGVVHVIIGRDGRVGAISPISGAELIRPALMAAIAQWSYRPFLVDGKPVEVDTTISMSISTGGVPSCANGDQPSAVHVSSGEIAGTILTKGQPIFPSDTFALGNGNHVSGANVMHVILGPDGHVDEITPVSGPEILRAGVTAAVAQWVYRPHLVDGRAVAVDTTVTVNF